MAYVLQNRILLYLNLFAVECRIKLNLSAFPRQLYRIFRRAAHSEINKTLRCCCEVYSLFLAPKCLFSVYWIKVLFFWKHADLKYVPGSGSRLVYLGSGSGSDQCVFTKNHHQKVCKNHEPLGTQPYGYVQVYVQYNVSFYRLSK